ncbi:nucleotidyl transferase AbiEii/AbiGii toxin family protein [Pseudoflavonifractor phocaeensis]|uniref:nucleotidyl transferase AbiEii/AbiGii toxin family protein n=1 Tax=Pseudoflavonifractor phocaeensis TaxID=1870988 RepID=UPI001F3D0A4A|nr:nucleotidyl transferase AbiEii/AbiGii toxin family protein [Pseudoflavonifractor phocaeensis]
MDMGASVIARLKNKAKETGKPFQLHLQLFCQEEFLRRLAASRYAENLVLKGGLFIYTLTNFESRATVDIDFLLRQFHGTVEDIKRMVDEIIAVDSGNDFITFTSRGFETISPQRKYKGVSFQLVGHIKNTRTPFDVDFGVGDVIVPTSHKRLIPVQLDGFDVPEVLTYSLESTIAEKYDALIQRLELTSRMKDIYDIYYLSSMFDFDGCALQQAVYETLQNRGTAYEKDSFDRVVALAENKDIQIRWRQYLRRLKMDDLALEDVVASLDRFLRPVWDAIVREEELFDTWSSAVSQWIDHHTTGGN